MPTMRCAALVYCPPFAAAFALPASAAAELKLEADLGQSLLPAGKSGTVYLRLSLKSLAGAKSEKRTPINAAIVIDRSGSMQGDRIAAAKEGARVALKRLSSDDKVALVAYNHGVEVLSPGGAPARCARQADQGHRRAGGQRHDGAPRRRHGGRSAGRGVSLRQ